MASVYEHGSVLFIVPAEESNNVRTHPSKCTNRKHTHTTGNVVPRLQCHHQPHGSPASTITACCRQRMPSHTVYVCYYSERYATRRP